MPNDKQRKVGMTRGAQRRRFERIFTEREKAALRHLSIRDSHLDGIDFSGADLRGSLFQNMTFTECDFSGADLTGVFFLNCDLRRSRFAGTLFGDNSFVGSWFTGARRIGIGPRRYIAARGGSFLRVVRARADRPAGNPHARAGKDDAE